VHIAHVFKDAHPPVKAGITRYIGDLATSSVRQRHQVSLHVCGSRSSRTDTLDDNVKVFRYRELGRALSTPLSVSFLGALRDIDADVIHLHMPNPTGELAALRSAPEIPRVATFHAQLGRQRALKPLYGPLQRSVLNSCGRVIVSSSTLRDSPELNGVQDRIETIPLGVSPTLVGPRPIDVAPSRPEWQLRLLFVGRLVYYKGVDFLLRAVAALPDVSLTIIGDGPLAPDIEAGITGLAVGNRVSLRRRVSDEDLHDAYFQHDVVVLPSVSPAEAFGLSMAEAMANGLPAISTSLGTGTDWVNVHGHTGLVVSPKDVAALTDAINDMRNPQTRHRFGAAALHRARTVLSHEAHAQRVMSIYEELVGA
jgi:glycosyltransferase involved in cell wall biosynthesis